MAELLVNMKSISLTCYNRPHYLKDMIESLRYNELYEYDRMFVQIEPSDKLEENIKILRGIDFIPVTIQINKERLGVRINPYSLLKGIFDSGYYFNVYLEDDMLLSPDAFDFFNFFYENFKGNPGIISGNLYNYQSNPDSKSKCQLRDDFCALGIGIFRSSWNSYFNKHWNDEMIRAEMKVDVGGIGGWDWCIRACMQKYKLKTLTPEYSRSFHTGATGHHCDVQCYDRMFKHHKYCKTKIGQFHL